MFTLPANTLLGSPRHACPCTPARSQIVGRQIRAPQRNQAVSRRQVRVSAKREWPDKELIAQALEEFPDKGVANVEEARALFANGGYKYLDVRPSVEYNDVGKVGGSVNIPIMNGTKKWSSEKQKKVFLRSENPDFIKLVEKAFPNKEEAKLLVGCSDGKRYSMDALMALDEAGYTNIVGLRGGYYKWFGTFDNKGNRRKYGEYQEDQLKGGDSTGIHGSGAGFERSDFVEPFVPAEYDEDEEEE